MREYLILALLIPLAAASIASAQVPPPPQMDTTPDLLASCRQVRDFFEEKAALLAAQLRQAQERIKALEKAAEKK